MFVSSHSWKLSKILNLICCTYVRCTKYTFEFCIRMKISILDMETRPSCKSFHYISASKNITKILIAVTVMIMLIILKSYTWINSFFQHAIKLYAITQSTLYLNKTKQRVSPTNLLNRIFKKFKYIRLNKNIKIAILNNYL